MTTTNYINSEDFTRIDNDTNGNPRYVCHFLAFIIQADSYDIGVSGRYALAVKRANKLGGRKFHTKAYGGGVVFQSYNLDETCRKINEMMQAIETEATK